MQASQKCIDLIKQFEGFSSKPYLCPAQVWTIGYGSTRYEDGRYVTDKDPHIDEAKAIAIMKVTLKEYESAVNRYVKVKLNQNQFDALVSFAYNLGNKALLNSTLLKRINEGNFLAANNEFRKWVFANGIKLQGLVRRREAERMLFGSMT
jgi:GH24 family phage-related lysozyme (muramidase)